MNTPRATDPSPALWPALDADRFVVDGISCYVAGVGAPMLLVHSVNAAGSAAEVRPLFDHFRTRRTVFALDLPGFGFSDRSDRAYTPRLMTDALLRIAREIELRCGAQPIDAMAASLGCEFLARAAVEQPALWNRLGLVSPTGLNGSNNRRGTPGSTRQVPGLLPLLRVSWWAQPLFDALTRPRVVRYFLERSWGGKQIDEAVWRYAVATARQPGARFAPQHFLAGALFSADIHDIYDGLTQPVWISHGQRGDFADFRGLAQLRTSARWLHTRFPTGALPYFELPQDFMRQAEAFFGLPAQFAAADSSMAGADVAGQQLREADHAGAGA